ncbi:MAG: Gfo/Idh/MocA family oxidoreductase [Ornithinimicrobium sp.]
MVRSGIIGTGFMGGVHAHSVRAAGGVVSQIAGSDSREAAEAATRLGAERGAASPEALVASADVDLVHVCTPNHTHADLARLALQHGKAVICEKPLATTLADADDLATLAREQSAITAVPFVYRFHPMVREMRARFATGNAGRIWLIHGSYLQDWLSRPGDDNWRVDPELGGRSRAFADIGVHWCDLMEFVTGHRVTSVMAGLATAYPGRSSTEDGAVVQFRTDQGATGSVVVSQVTPGRKNRLWLSVDGTESSYAFDQEDPVRLWVGSREGNRVVVRDPAQLHAEAARYARLPAGHPQGFQDAFTSFVADVRCAVTGARPDGLPDFDDGARAARITEAVLRSATSERWADVPAAPPDASQTLTEEEHV